MALPKQCIRSVCRADPSVLWLHYEDLHEDLPAAVRLIAEFLGTGADDPGKLEMPALQAAVQRLPVINL